MARITRSNLVDALRVAIFVIAFGLLLAVVPVLSGESSDALSVAYLIGVQIVLDSMIVYFSNRDTRVTARAAGASLLCWGALFAVMYVTENVMPFGYETWKFLLKWVFVVLISAVAAVVFPPVQAAQIVLAATLATVPAFSGMYLGEGLRPVVWALSLVVPLLIWFGSVVPLVLALRAAVRAAARERVTTLRARAVPLGLSVLGILVVAPVYQWSLSPMTVLKAGTDVAISESVNARVPDGFRGELMAEPPLFRLLRLDTSGMGTPGLYVSDGDPYGPQTPETSTGRVDMIERKYYDEAVESRSTSRYGDQGWVRGELDVPGAGRADVFAIAPVKDTYPSGEVAVFVPAEPTPVVVSVGSPELARALEAGASLSDLGRRALEFMAVSFE